MNASSDNSLFIKFLNSKYLKISILLFSQYKIYDYGTLKNAQELY